MAITVPNMEETMKKATIVMIAILALLMLPVFGAGSKEAKPQETTQFAWVEEQGVNGLPGVNPIKVSGNIITAGSSTV